MSSEKTNIVTDGALQGALEKIKDKFATKSDLNSLNRTLQSFNNSISSKISANTKSITANADSITSLREEVDGVGVVRATLSVSYNSSTGEADATASGFTFNDLMLYNQVLTVVTDTVTGNVSDDIYGTVVSTERYSKLIMLEMGYDISNSSPIVLFVKINDDNTLNCITLPAKTSAASEHNTWKGCTLTFVENSEEYTIYSHNRGEIDLGSVKVGDTVTFDVMAGSSGSTRKPGALTGVVSTIAIDLNSYSKERLGCTVILDPWYGTDWKYRTLKMRYDGYNWTTYYYQ